jgi:hypothetical protein
MTFYLSENKPIKWESCYCMNLRCYEIKKTMYQNVKMGFSISVFDWGPNRLRGKKKSSWQVFALSF